MTYNLLTIASFRIGVPSILFHYIMASSLLRSTKIVKEADKLELIRGLPDITSGPEVQQIFKIRTVRKPDVFLPGHLTLKNRKRNPKKLFSKNFFFKIFFIFFLFIYMGRVQLVNIHYTPAYNSFNSYI